MTEIPSDFFYSWIIWKLKKKVLILVVLQIYGSQDTNSADPWKLRKIGQAKQDEIREKSKPGRYKKGNNYVGMKEVETCPNVSQQPGAVIKSVNMILGCINRCMTCRSHGVICLFWLGISWALIEELCIFWCSIFIRNCGEIEEDLAGGHKNGPRYQMYLLWGKFKPVVIFYSKGVSWEY